MRAHRACAYDGCRNALEYFQHTVKELNNRHYCSQDCLNKQYQGLGYQGAVHLVHQEFGPTHPVTRLIKHMRLEQLVMYQAMDQENHDRFLEMLKEKKKALKERLKLSKETNENV